MNQQLAYESVRREGNGGGGGFDVFGWVVLGSVDGEGVVVGSIEGLGGFGATGAPVECFVF